MESGFVKKLVTLVALMVAFQTGISAGLMVYGVLRLAGVW
jgi:hypothetical protein